MAPPAAAAASALLLLLAFAVAGVVADGSDHRYKAGEPVPLYANKVGPFHNPSETYRYFDLPFCSPEKVKDKSEALGEVLNGDRLVDAPYKLDFRVEQDSKQVCSKKLTKEDVAKFRNAVAKDYYFQMYYDDLPLWGFIGKVEKGVKADPSEWKYYLYRHIIFDILYNNDRVIEINVHTDQSALVDLTEDKEVNVEFLYSVKWKETATPFEKRMEKYSSSSNLPHHLEVHWFSIINSCVTVLLLTGFLATILMRVLKNDFVNKQALEALREGPKAVKVVWNQFYNMKKPQGPQTKRVLEDSSSNADQREVYLFSLNPIYKGKVVAKGNLVSSDSTHVVGGNMLGDEYYGVAIHGVTNIGDEWQPRPFEKYCTVKDAIGCVVAWPRFYVKKA